MFKLNEPHWFTYLNYRQFCLLDQEPEIPEKKSKGVFRKIFKLIFWLCISIVLLLISAVALVLVYEDDVKSAIIGELNKSLRSEVRVAPENIKLTVLKTFPKCAIQFKNVLIMEAVERKQCDTLVFANDIFLLFNLKDIWNKNYTINNIRVNKAICKLVIDKKGRPNYIFWKSSENKSNESLNFRLDQIELNEISLKYKNVIKKVKTAVFFHHSEFSGSFGENDYSLIAKGAAAVDHFTLNKNILVKNKKISYHLDFNVSGSEYVISNAELVLNNIYFSLDGSCTYHDSLQNADIRFKGKNLDIASVLSLLPEKESQRIKEYESEGEFYCKGSLHYKAGISTEIESDFGIRNATVIYQPNNTKLSELSIEGKLLSNETESYLHIKNVTAAIGNNTLKGFCNITDLKDPYLNISADIKTELKELNDFWPMDTIESISGTINLNAVLKGKWSEINKSAFAKEVIAQGTASFKEIRAKIKGNPKELNIPEGNLEMANRGISVNNFKMLVGSSDIELNGNLPGFINYITDNTSPLIIEAGVKSKELVLEDFLFSGGTSGDKKISLPDNLQFKLAAEIEHLSFAKFRADNIQGDVLVDKQKIMVNDLWLNTMDGKAQLSAMADASGDAIKIQSVSELKNINISKLFYECNNFGQTTLNEKNLNGFATATLNFSGSWSKELKADLSSITANGNITIEQGRLVDFKPLLSLSKYIEVNELKDIKFQTLQSNFEIKNQLISIPKTNIKNSALNLELWGKHSFSNEIDYHIKLLLSEVLANKKRANQQLDEELVYEENDKENRRCVFLLMTGTVENPIIKYDRKGMRQKIGEDLKTEKQTLKQLLKEEFGLFKSDSTLKKENKLKAEEKFNIEFGDNKGGKSTNHLQPKKKKEEDDDDF